MNFIIMLLLSRLKEASTWRGLVMLLTGAGLTIAPEWQNAIIATGVSVSGAIGLAVSDKIGDS